MGRDNKRFGGRRVKKYLQKTEKILNDYGYLCQVEVNDNYCELVLENIDIRAFDNDLITVDVFDDNSSYEIKETIMFRTQKALIEFLEYRGLFA